jgi:hypothetical protein
VDLIEKIIAEVELNDGDYIETKKPAFFGRALNEWVDDLDRREGDCAILISSPMIAAHPILTAKEFPKVFVDFLCIHRVY